MVISQRIGFVGAGKIGEPMIERLLAAGHPVSVYARRPEVRERLGLLGATTPPQIADIAAAPLVLVCLFDDTQLLDVAPTIIENMSPGAVFASHTTGSPHTIAQLEQLGTARGVSIVEAPFSGTPAAIRAGRLTVLLGGDETPTDVVARTVTAYASTIHRTGGLGTALSAKLLNNALFAACTQITLSALDSARRLGIDDRVLLDVLADSSGGSAAAGYIAASGEEPSVYSNRIARYLTKDLDAARSAAQDLGVDVSALLAAARLGPMNLDIDAQLVSDRAPTG
ncbi:NAD-binding protein [Gordonia pseudamarae]|uniref:NAD-binding protein n=1 Tax=Gordonia pseudamarae TaxID=2831662 RepID=A0ABX6IGE1_9ACTN|nr:MULTISPECIES: NAD(P)-binding domain-containing protein [Gordonia]MBD0021750.1 NAD(P)-dependent oxidoreductase [Gordonia sp. (in: high G+C Gram-positive bacteria)]QHN25280.1 NAD-binding protein [Gordonia pseudamarae]QHN34211.1 NAD-binding protein [Gordonia pseudamarae]